MDRLLEPVQDFFVQVGHETTNASKQWKKLGIFSLSIKGQLISKTNCQAMDSSKKRTNEFVFTSKNKFLFVFLKNPWPEKNVSRLSDL